MQKGKEKKHLISKREIWNDIMDAINKDTKIISDQLDSARLEYPELIRSIVLLLAYSDAQINRLRKMKLPKELLEEETPEEERPETVFITWLEEKIKEESDLGVKKLHKKALENWHEKAKGRFPMLEEISELAPRTLDYTRIVCELFGQDTLECKCIKGDLSACKELIETK